jgi:O-antigen/teichoic acid export membrane protein
MKNLKNITFTTATMVVPLAVSVVTVPFYLDKIGAERYGALAIAWLLLGYFAQADFGIGRAVTQRISAMRKDERRPGAAAKVVWSATLLASLIGVASAALIYVFAGYFFTNLFEVEEQVLAELRSALILLALSGPVVNVFSVATGALLGLEKVRGVAVLKMGNQLSLQLFPLLAAYLIDIKLQTLIAAALAGRILTMLPACVLVWRALLSGLPVAASRADIRRLANFGAWIMVSSIVSPLMVISDRFVIGAVAGAVAVAAYTIPFQIASRTMVLPYAIMHVLFPQLAGLSGEEARQRAKQALVAMGTVFAPAMIGLIVLAEPLLVLWLGERLDPRSALIGQIVLVGWWSNSLAQVPFGLIQAQGNPRFTATLHVVELPAYVLALWGLGSAFGLPGMAAAFSIRCLVDFFALAAKARVLSPEILLRLLPSAVLIAVAFVAGQKLTDPWTCLALASFLAGLGALWSWQVLPPAVKAQILAAARLPDRA